MPWILWGLALLAGALNTVQSGTNATLNKVLGQPVLAALAVYAGGVAGALLASPFLGLSWRDLGGLSLDHIYAQLHRKA
ncbi:DMT family transporter, partial [Roseomonas sp. TAS13]|uniref:DMT family transporter n=1 Tax=Roseomonas sp. TAS13 TaxID=1926319 RepID=UPI000B20B6E1